MASECEDVRDVRGPPGVGPDYWLAFFEEKAGFFEFDCGLSRAEAEAAAADSMVLEWARLASRRDDPERMAALEAAIAEHPANTALTFL